MISRTLTSVAAGTRVAAGVGGHADEHWGERHWDTWDTGVPATWLVTWPGGGANGGGNGSGVGGGSGWVGGGGCLDGVGNG